MAAFASAPEVGRRVLLSFAGRGGPTWGGGLVWTSVPKAAGPHLLLDATYSSLSLSLSLSHCLAATSPVAPVDRDLQRPQVCLFLPIARHPQIIETYRESSKFRTFPRKAQRPVATEAKAGSRPSRPKQRRREEPGGRRCGDLRHPWREMCQHTCLLVSLQAAHAGTPHPVGETTLIGERDREDKRGHCHVPTELGGWGVRDQGRGADVLQAETVRDDVRATDFVLEYGDDDSACCGRER